MLAEFRDKGKGCSCNGVNWLPLLFPFSRVASAPTSTFLSEGFKAGSLRLMLMVHFLRRCQPRRVSGRDSCSYVMGKVKSLPQRPDPFICSYTDERRKAWIRKDQKKEEGKKKDMPQGLVAMLVY